MFKMAASMLQTCIGKVFLCNSLSKAVHVSVMTMKFEPNIHVYYNSEAKIWAADPNLNCQVGDMVLIKSLAHPQSTTVKHEVIETVFPVGHIIDPVTGRRCRGHQYLDEDHRSFRKLPISTQE